MPQNPHFEELVVDLDDTPHPVTIKVALTRKPTSVQKKISNAVTWIKRDLISFNQKSVEALQSIFQFSPNTRELVEAGLEYQATPADSLQGWLVDDIFTRRLQPLLNQPLIAGVLLESNGIQRTAVAANTMFTWPVTISFPTKGDLALGQYQLKNRGLATINELSQRAQSPIKQVTVFADQAAEAMIWASAGMQAGTSKFLRLINRHQLSGVLVDHALGVIHFEQGKLMYGEAS